jgi:hypothetical protein
VNFESGGSTRGVGLLNLLKVTTLFGIFDSFTTIGCIFNPEMCIGRVVSKGSKGGCLGDLVILALADLILKLCKIAHSMLIRMSDILHRSPIPL